MLQCGIPSPRHLRVFISSPGDVAAERDVARATLSDIQASQAWTDKFTFSAMRWDDRDAPFPLDAQVPPQVGFERGGKRPAECDIVLVILWSRIGTPLAAPLRPDGTQYESGTEYEFENALTNPLARILVYRRLDEPVISLRTPDIADRQRQLERVDAFFTRFQEKDGALRGGYRTYRGLDEFGPLLRRDLEGVLRELELEPPRAQAAQGAGTPHYFAVQRGLIAAHSSSFVGRSAADSALTEFLGTRRRGYFVVVGPPGEGKTAFAAHIVSDHGYVHHFVNRSGGRADVRLILCSLIEQVAARTNERVDFDRPLPELAKKFEELLASAASKAGGIVVVIDALDELPDEAADDVPFLITESLTDGTYVVVTSRAGGRVDRLRARLAGVPSRTHTLGPLTIDEVRSLVHGKVPVVTESQTRRLFQASRGNPLYLHAALTEWTTLKRIPQADLPADIEAYFARQLGTLSTRPVLVDTLGVLAVARRPPTVREIAEITGHDYRRVDEEGVGPIRHLLQTVDGGFTFYHERFHEFVISREIYADELRRYHGKIAQWLMRRDQQRADDRWGSLAHHLFESGDSDTLVRTVDASFLEGKLRRFGYAVLEDVDLVSRALLDSGDPSAIERCTGLIDAITRAGGDDLALQASRTVRFGNEGGMRVQRPRAASIATVDVDIAIVPRSAVSADFAVAVPDGDRVAVMIGDAPASGLTSAFVARFAASAFRQRVRAIGTDQLSEIVEGLRSTLRRHRYFDRLAVLAAVLDPSAGVLTIANAGLPFPVRRSGRTGRCDRLVARGDLLTASDAAGRPWLEVRHCELDVDDAVIFISDGITEASRLDDPYGYRFKALLENHAYADAAEMGAAILTGWFAHARPPGYVDDATVVTAIVRSVAASHG